MAQKSYKVNEAVEVVYQALNSQTGITINMEVYDETHIIVVGGPVALTELGTSGRYYGNFTPDAEGEWSVQVEQSDGTGKVTKAFSVGAHNIGGIGAIIDTMDTKVDDIGIKIDGLSSPPMIG